MAERPRIKSADFHAEPLPEVEKKQADENTSLSTTSVIEKEVQEETKSSMNQFELPLGFIDPCRSSSVISATQTGGLK